MMNKSLLVNSVSVRKRIVVLFFIFIILPFIFLAYYSYHQSVKGISEANASFSLDFLIQSKKNFEGYLKDLNEQMNNLIGTKKLQDLMIIKPKGTVEEEAYAAELENFVYEKKPVVDAYRIRVYPLLPLPYNAYIRHFYYGNDISKQNWFIDIKKNGRPSWYLFVPEDNKDLYPFPIISYVKRFTGLYDNIPRGIIIADLSEDNIYRYLSTPQKLNGQETFLLDDHGVIISHPQKNKIGTIIESPELIDLIGLSHEGTEIIKLNKTKFLATFVKLERQPWTIVSMIPLSEMTKSIKKISNVTYYFLLGYILSCIIVILFITNFFTNPIVHLVRSMRKIDTNNVAMPLQYLKRQDEIGLLYRGFDQMRSKNHDLIEEVHQSVKIKKELEFQVLSHQINPHFLYNTLESIRWKAEQSHMKEISEMVSALGNLLRLSLNQGQELTTVSREIEHLRAYIHIEKARLDKPFRIMIQVDEDTLQLPLLRLIFQPLIENAIHHGIRDNPETGKIILTGKLEGNDLYFELIDNGKGISQHIIQEMNDPLDGIQSKNTNGGVGLTNVNKRLKLYFGEAYGLQIICESGKGTKIIIKHPVLPENYEG
jgi:two-component system sensor histidine kinase YesM